MIGVLTYNVPHRKTYDTLCLLKAKGYTDIVVFAMPLHYQKKFKPLILHRPSVSVPFPIEDICKAFGYKCCLGFSESALPLGSKILICGAGMVEQEIISKYTLLNAHPGYLPNVRGLDALKWAIYDGQPIGVTTHVLGDEVDAGLMVDRKTVPVFHNDTFHAVAQRQYELEVAMLVEALEKVETATEHLDANFPLRRRMPHDFETRIFSRFAALVGNVQIEGAQ
ncbi:hypothetical protein LJC26_01285 [Desulfovibrio sp. OttesenSCG-928-O18]|nr:hypothetical protein [Desulfovibrio sp. OttesenSCG-928-O18]